MSQKMYVLYDCKSETYTAPTVNPARGQALRDFGDAVNNKERGGILFSHPQDFTLFEIGDYDTNTGIITLYEARIAVANGLDLKIADEPAKPQRPE